MVGGAGTLCATLWHAPNVVVVVVVVSGSDNNCNRWPLLSTFAFTLTFAFGLRARASSCTSAKLDPLAGASERASIVSMSVLYATRCWCNERLVLEPNHTLRSCGKRAQQLLIRLPARLLEAAARLCLRVP